MISAIPWVALWSPAGNPVDASRNALKKRRATLEPRWCRTIQGIKARFALRPSSLFPSMAGIMIRSGLINRTRKQIRMSGKGSSRSLALPGALKNRFFTLCLTKFIDLSKQLSGTLQAANLGGQKPGWTSLVIFREIQGPASTYLHG